MDARPEADTYVTNEDLLVPTNEIPALQQVISRLNLSEKNEDEKLLAINQFFVNNFTYTLRQDPPTPDSPALARFLLQTRSGYCEYFATATVLLLRQLGIPARYAVGYYVHEAAGHGYVVRERDAHAWCMVWDEKKQVWKNFDTTPPSWVAQGQDTGSIFQFLSDFQSWLKYQVLKFFEYGHSNIREYLFWGLIPALAFLLYRIFRSSRRSKKDGDSSEHMDWPGLDSEFYQLEQRLTQLGLPRQPGELLSTWLRRATDNADFAEFKEPLENILQLHYRHRFDPRGLSPAERQELRRQVENLLLPFRQLPSPRRKMRLALESFFACGLGFDPARPGGRGDFGFGCRAESAFAFARCLRWLFCLVHFRPTRPLACCDPGAGRSAHGEFSFSPASPN